MTSIETKKAIKEWVNLGNKNIKTILKLDRMVKVRYDKKNGLKDGYIWLEVYKKGNYQYNLDLITNNYNWDTVMRVHDCISQFFTVLNHELSE